MSIIFILYFYLRIKHKVSAENVDIVQKAALALFENNEKLCYVIQTIENDNLLNFLGMNNFTVFTVDYNLSIDVDCTSYILTGANLKILESLVNSELLENIKTHSKIMIIIDGSIKFDFSVFHHISLQQALDIIIIQENMQNQLYMDHAKNTSSKFFLYSSIQNKILLYSTSSKIDLSQELFKAKWNPLDMLMIMNKTFKVLGFPSPPNVIINDGKLTGLDVEMLRIILKNWPIHFEIVEEQFSPFQYMIKRLKNRTADLAISGIWVNIRLIKSKVWFSSTYLEQCVTYLVHKPILLPNSTFIFQSFQLNLWFLTASAVGVLAIFLMIFEKIFAKNRKCRVAEHGIIVICRLVGSSFYEGTFAKIRCVKIILIVWSICSVLMTTYYNAGLTSLLQYPRVTMEVDTLRELINMKINCFEYVGAFKDHMRALGGQYAKIAELIIYETNTTHINEKLRSGKFAVRVEIFPNSDIGNSEKLDDYGKKHMKVLKECLIKHHLAFLTQLNSPYLHYINERTMQMVSCGLIDALFRKVIGKKDQKDVALFHSSYSSDLSQRFGLSKIQGSFWLLSFGCLVGMSYFMWEILRK
ncbi:hypothetical protein HHI36_017007 [Cryptolaemus montrouzieri]|uniref:Ionotropic glutamate receptor C-terminal domain-containing protein n=1 Tax=Cryptolaemus montrouzieri TaxID=559131 RepID=A0ABD2NM24_9CUCU